jgi:hypothetical protein
MISFKCPSCQREARASDEHAGKRAKCPKCDHIFQIPAPSAAAKASAAPAKSSAAPPAKTKPTPASPPASNKAAAAAPKPPAKKAPPPPPVEDDFEEVEEDEVEEVEEAEEVEEVTEAVAADDEDEEDYDDEEEEERPRKKAKKPKKSAKRKRRPGEYAPCPGCGSTDATRQYFTFWGSWLGPLIINHVRCNDCGTYYNGVHGDSNNTRIMIYVLCTFVPVFIILLGCGALNAFLGVD